MKDYFHFLTTDTLIRKVFAINCLEEQTTQTKAIQLQRLQTKKIRLVVRDKSKNFNYMRNISHSLGSSLFLKLNCLRDNNLFLLRCYQLFDPWLFQTNAAQIRTDQGTSKHLLLNENSQWLNRNKSFGIGQTDIFGNLIYTSDNII